MELVFKNFYGAKKKLTIANGSVIFWKGGLLVGPISKQTRSLLTHSAIVLYKDGGPWVYEATTPCVRCMRLGEYESHLKTLGDSRFFKRRDFSWFIVQPRLAYTIVALGAMHLYAKSQLGRPYMLRGWWQQQEVRGIFCSQYVGNIIEKSGLIQSANYQESPGSLYQKLLPYYN